jgi:mycothiol synthase
VTADPLAAASSESAALTWYDELEAGQAREVTALLDAATAADHTAPVGEAALLHLTGRGAEHLLARDPDSGTLTGYAVLELPAAPDPDVPPTSDAPGEAVAELAVHPSARRRGVGSALVAGLTERAAGTTLRVWAHGELPGAVALADRTGFRQVRALWQMWRDLREPLAEPEFAPDVRLRAFEVGRDEAEFLRVNNAAFAWHPEQGGWDVEQVRAREGAAWFDPAGFLLAVPADDPDRVLGYHWTKVHPTGARAAPDRSIGEVYVLGVDPAEHGRRLGTALTLAGLLHLRGRDLDEVMLYVESDNHAAVAVYRRLGFSPWHTDAAYLREAPAGSPKGRHAGTDTPSR